MAKSIGPGELFGVSNVGISEAPVHTIPAHRRCAYYVNPNPDPEDGTDLLVCAHHYFLIGGAVYSEDFIKQQLFPLIHQAIATFDDLIDGGEIDAAGADAILAQLREMTK